MKKSFIRVFLILTSLFLFSGCSSSKLKIVMNEASKLSLEEYSNGVFSMKKPRGWDVSFGGSGMYYAIRVNDSNNSNNGLFLMIKMQPLLKSVSAKSFWQDYYTMSGNSSEYKVFADAVVLSNPTVSEFYTKFNEVTAYMKNIESTLSSFKFPTYNSFTVKEELVSNASMKNYALDSKVLRANFTGENDKKGEGLFLASIVNFGDYKMGEIDTMYYMVYDIMTITADENDFIDYKDILLESINSIEFSDSYVKNTIDDGNTQTKKALELNDSIQKSFDSYMSAWERRNKTYDIMSQKQSDATLGYERVYDTETNEIYKAYDGFTNDYDGERYKKVTDDMYTKRTTGYIEK